MSLLDLSAEELTALSVLVGFALSPGLTPNQQNTLGNFLMAVGQILESIAAQQTLLNSRNVPSARQLQCQLEQLQCRLERLEGTHPHKP